MDLQNLLNQFLGTVGNAAGADNQSQGSDTPLSTISQNIPGGLVGGAAAGGLMALLIGNKSARKMARSVAGYGGAAVLGGLAYKAYQNWQRNSSAAVGSRVAQNGTPQREAIEPPERQQPVSEMTLIKAMIAAAKSDGHIDAQEQNLIFQATDQLDLPADKKGMVFDCLRHPVTVAELASEARTAEHKAEVYLASCMVIELDHPSERGHLDELAAALDLPRGLTEQLEMQARQAVAA
jgi:uncharacterized membrane protein YebE (DUF533 family)